MNEDFEFDCHDVDYHIANIIGEWPKKTDRHVTKEQAKEAVMLEFERYLDDYLEGWPGDEK